jgi:RecB family endonuclease NucS
MTGFTELLDRNVEILGERALPEGHVDLLIRDSEPVGRATNVPIEVKLNQCSKDDLEQLTGYIRQLEPECPGGVLLAETIPRDFETPNNVRVVRASFEGLDMGTQQQFQDMLDSLRLAPVER